MAIIPGLAWKVGIAVLLMISLLILLWQFEPFRVRRSVALVGCISCFIALAGLSFAIPMDGDDEFLLNQYVSKFARSGAVAAVDLVTRGVLEADTSAPDRLNLANVATCDARRKLPYIIMVFDESSFDVTMMPNVVVPEDYTERFRSSDGKLRSLVVEGAGGPSWYTEYNVLTGLSVRSYGRFADSVTKLAAGHVKRGMPYALRHCGYSTYSLYSWSGAFLGARGFQTATGIEHFLDAKQLRAGPADTDSFFYDHAIRVIAQEHDRGPAFVFVYLAANHFPWTYHYRPDLLTEWVNPGNPFEIDEYLRRQEMSMRDYAQFKQRLAQEFPDQQFLLVRFGDHQPLFAKRFLEPALDPSEVAQRIRQRDPRYFTTYYALEGVNFRPVDLFPRSRRLMRPICRSWCWKGQGYRSIPLSRNRKRFSTAATACSISVRTVPRRGNSTVFSSTPASFRGFDDRRPLALPRGGATPTAPLPALACVSPGGARTPRVRSSFS